MPVTAENDARIVAYFRNHTKLNQARTKQEGRPIYDEMEVVEIRLAGDRQTVSVHRADAFAGVVTLPDGTQEEQTYAERFATQYDQFKKKTQQTQAGTPLSELPFLTEGKRKELKAVNVHTAEQLADLDGQRLKNLGVGGREMKNQARAYIDNAAGSADVTRLAAENEVLRRQLEELQSQVPARQEQVKAEESAQPVDTREAEEVEADDTADQNGGGSQFDSLTVEELKTWIEDETGSRPQGRPSKADLVAMAEELEAGKQ